MLRVLLYCDFPVLYKNDLIGGRLIMAGKSMRILGCKEPLSMAFFFFFRSNIIVFFSVGVFILIFFFNLADQAILYIFIGTYELVYISWNWIHLFIDGVRARKSVGRKCAHFDNKGREQYDILRRKMIACGGQWTLWEQFTSRGIKYKRCDITFGNS